MHIEDDISNLYRIVDDIALVLGHRLSPEARLLLENIQKQWQKATSSEQFTRQAGYDELETEKLVACVYIDKTRTNVVLTDKGSALLRLIQR